MKTRLILSLVILVLYSCTERITPTIKRVPSSIQSSTDLSHDDQLIYAIGDIHGDLKRAQDVLRTMNLIDEKGHWIGKDAILVQTGDQIDRYTNDRDTIDYFIQLKEEATKAGGNVFSLLGNHELYNTRMIFREIPEEAMNDFKEFYKEEKLPIHCQKNYEKYTVPYYDSPYFNKQSEDDDPVPVGIRARAQAFCPGGPYASILSKRPITLIVGNTLFIHGSMEAKYAEFGREGLLNLNKEVSLWLQNKLTLSSYFKYFENDFLRDKASPFRSRYFSKDMSEAKCEELEKVLEKLEVKRMVVGHTIQMGGVSNDCNGKIWRIDTGFSRGFGFPLEKHAQGIVISEKEQSVHIKGITADHSDQIKYVNNSSRKCSTPKSHPPKCIHKVAEDIFHYLAGIDQVLEGDYQVYSFMPKKPEEDLKNSWFGSDMCYFELKDHHVFINGYDENKLCN